MRPRATMLTSLAALGLMPMLLLTACSSSSDTQDPTNDARGDSAQALASCMRDRGYDFDDLDTAGSRTELSVPEGVDPDSYQADLSACLGSAPGADSGSEQAQQLPGADEADEQYAACLTEAGFDDFPDDKDEWRTYVPTDQDAFDTASDSCGDEAYAHIGDGYEER